MRLFVVVRQICEVGAELVDAGLVVEAAQAVEIRDAFDCEIAKLLDFRDCIRGDDCGGPDLPGYIPHKLNREILRFLVPAH